jgi:hypothetical protein
MRRKVMLGVFGLLGCTAQLQQQLDQTRTEVRDLKNQLAHTNDELERHRSTSTLEINSLWGRMECGNDRVRRFLSECDSQAHTTLYVRNQGPTAPVPFRIGHLSLLTELRNIHPTTRFLVLVQPRSEGSEAEQEARRIGKDVVAYLRNDYKIPSNVKIVGPVALPCKLKAEQLKSYMSRNDRPRSGEAPEKERLRAWIFRTDC